MQQERAKVVEELFQRAADLPDSKRKQFLDEQCGSDEALRGQIETLLRHEMQATGSFLERKPTTTRLPAEAPGTTIGHYRILEPIGEGGFAVVYLAQQQEPIRRRVAIKIIKLGMDTKQVIARFEAERQALALMDHASVAKVLDAGTTETGRPYFVMEHVPGVAITEHCDRHRLSIEERLKLFMQVCDAVQHAHQKGIIHRDIKPSNVLVTIGNGQVPKVIDFGVAKALHQRLTEQTMFTEQGQLIGTPEYMSPEQAEMTAQDIDTRSDIYSLGVLLYQLLTGALPFDAKRLHQAGFPEILRIIREEDADKPSTRLSTLGEESTTSAQKRRLDPRALVRELRGDLDWIAMKALEKDRTRRYASASEFAADIRRHLEHEPVIASPPTAAYRLKKYVRRHRVGVTAGAALVVALLGGISGTSWMAWEANVAHDAEATQREIAQNEAAIAAAVNAFLNDDLLAAVAPSAQRGKGKDVLMRDVLDEAAKRIEEASAVGGRFEDKSVVEASIRQTLGVTYWQLGEYPAAEPHLERARQLRRHVLGEEHPDTLESMGNLANLYSLQGRYEEAEPLYLKTLEIRKRLLGGEHPDTRKSMNNLAILYWYQGRYDESEPLYLETLKIDQRALGREHPDTLKSMNNLAILYGAQGRYDKAEPLYVETLEIRKRVLGAEHPETLKSMGNLANLYSNQGRYDEAEPLYLETLEIQERVLSGQHPLTVMSMRNLASLYLGQGRYEEAEPLFIETLEIQERVLGEEHRDTLASMSNLAVLYADQGRYDEAETLFLETLEVQKRVLGEEHLDTLASMNNLAHLYQSQGRYEQAEPLAGRALEIFREVLGKEHPNTLNAEDIMGTILLETGQIEKAETLFRNLVTTSEHARGADFMPFIRAKHGMCLVELGRYEEAEPLLLETYPRLPPLPDADTRDTIRYLAILYDAWGKPEKAAEWRAKLAETEEAAARE